MKVPSNLNKGSVNFNMTPMIDIVFQLIIFFLVSSHLARQETQLELDLPSAESGQRIEEETGERLIVNVLPGGEIQLAGQTVSLAEFRDKVAFERQRRGDELEVRIRSDRNAPYRLVEPLMTACARSGVWNVTFAVIRPSDAPGG